MNWPKTIDEIDSWVRQAQHSQAKEALLSLIETSSIPRMHRHELAALARRLGLPELSIRLLRPFVRPSGRKQSGAASDAEKAEYAGALIRLGIVSEALSLLESVDTDKYPRALLFRAFALVSKWQYAESETPLRALLTHPRAHPYDVLVAEMNLCAIFLFCRKLLEAEAHLYSLRKKSSDTQSWFIYSTALEFSAELAILQRNWLEAEQYLTQAEKLLSHSDTIDALLLRKQRAILSLKRAPQNKTAYQQMRHVRLEAIKRRHWETLRDCDYHLAVAKQEQKAALFLYFGTPYASFRERLLSEFPSPLLIPSSYCLKLGRGRKTVRLDPAFLKPGQLQHRLLLALCSDFYRPKSLLDLHEFSYPDRHFDPGSSRNLIYQACHRLKQSFQKAQLPLTVAESFGFFKLQATDPQISVTISITPIKNHSHFERIVHEALTSAHSQKLRTPFSKQQFAEHAGLSPRSANRYLSCAIQQNWIQKLGTGPATRYRFDADSFCLHRRILSSHELT